MAIIWSNFNRFTKLFAGRFLGKFAAKPLLEILAYVATLPRETLGLMSENKRVTINCKVE